MKRTLPFILLLSACSSNPGVVSMSNGDYLITRTADRMSADIATLRAEAMQAASDFCLGQGMTLAQHDSRESSQPSAHGHHPGVALTFRCMPKPATPEQSGRKGG